MLNSALDFRCYSVGVSKSVVVVHRDGVKCYTINYVVKERKRCYSREIENELEDDVG